MLNGIEANMRVQIMCANLFDTSSSIWESTVDVVI